MTEYQTMPSQDFFRRWLKKPHFQGFAFDLTQMLPDCGAASTVTESQVADLLARHRLTPLMEKAQLAATTILKVCASKASAAELQAGTTSCLLALGSQLGASLPDIEASLAEVRGRLFRSAYDKARLIGPIRGERRSEVFGFAASLGLTDPETQIIVNQANKAVFDSKMAPILKDPIISPEFERELEEIAEDAGLKLALADEETERIFALGRLRWQIRNGQIPIEDSPLMLKRGETCHGSTRAKLFETRTKQGQSYALQVGRGTLVITDKRLLYTGDEKSLSIGWESITDWEFFTDGIQVRRGTGKPVTFVYGQGNQFFTEVMVVARSKFIG